MFTEGVPPTVLIVEADALTRMRIGDLAADLGYVAIETRNKSQALEILAIKPAVEVVIIDARLSDNVSGFELAEIVAKGWPSANLIITSGYDRPTMLPEGSIYLQKPVSEVQLRQILGEYAGRLRSAFASVDLV